MDGILCNDLRECKYKFNDVALTWMVLSDEDREDILRCSGIETSFSNLIMLNSVIEWSGVGSCNRKLLFENLALLDKNWRVTERGPGAVESRSRLLSEEVEEEWLSFHVRGYGYELG